MFKQPIKNEIYSRLRKKGLVLFFISTVAVGGLWFAGCASKQAIPTSPNASVQAQPSSTSTFLFTSTTTPTEVFTTTTTPTSTATFIPTTVFNPGNEIVTGNNITLTSNNDLSVSGGTAGNAPYGYAPYSGSGGAGGNAGFNADSVSLTNGDGINVSGGNGEYGSGGAGGNANVTVGSLSLSSSVLKISGGNGGMSYYGSGSGGNGGNATLVTSGGMIIN